MDPSVVRQSRLSTVTRNESLVIFAINVIVLVMALVAGALGPPLMITKSPHAGGDYVDLKHSESNCHLNPDGTVINPPIPRCWSHEFEFHQDWTQFFELEMEVNRPKNNASHRDRAAYVLSLHVEWEAEEVSGSNEWKEVVDETVERAVICGDGESKCLPLSVFRTNAITSDVYYFRVSLPTEETNSELGYLDTVNFLFRYRNPEFARWELGFKAVLSLLSIVALGMHLYTVHVDGEGLAGWCMCCRRQGVPTSSAFAVNWMGVLLVLLIGFNNPLFFLEFVDARTFWAFLAAVGQIAFVAGLLTFWVCEFSLLSLKEPQTATMTWFFLPKLAIMGLWALVMISFYSFLIVRETEDPIYDWRADREILPSVVIFIAVTIGLYVFYIAVIVVWSLVRVCMRDRTWPEIGVLALHCVVLLALIGGLIGGSILQYDVGNTLDFLFFHICANAYVFTLAYLYAPAPLLPTRIGDGAAAPAVDWAGTGAAAMGQAHRIGDEEEEDDEGLREDDVDVAYGGRLDNEEGDVEMTQPQNNKDDDDDFEGDNNEKDNFEEENHDEKDDFEEENDEEKEVQSPTDEIAVEGLGDDDGFDDVARRDSVEADVAGPFDGVASEDEDEEKKPFEEEEEEEEEEEDTPFDP